MPKTAEQLLEACESARRAGSDFPSVWLSVLRPHPLVLGLPTHEVIGGRAVIVIALTTGQKIHSSIEGYGLA